MYQCAVTNYNRREITVPRVIPIESTPATAIWESYHWVPSDIFVSSIAKSKFLTPVLDIPLSDAEFYTSLESILDSMLPMFAKLGLLSTGVARTLQIVVKAQMYTLQPKQTYSGKWHVEGLIENVVAAGV